MNEIKMTIEIPGLPEALNALAEAIGKQPEIVCHQHGGNNHHIDNAGVVNVDFPVAPAARAVNPTTPVQPAPTTGTVVPTPVQPTAPTTAAPTAPVALGESYTLEALSRAGAALIDTDAGKMPQLLALLGKYGVQAMTQLPKEAYSAFGADLKALGAQL